MILSLFRNSESSPRLECLRALSLFIDLSPGELKIVDGLFHERDFVKDEVIFDKGEEGQAIYIIIDGSVLIRDPGQPEEDGKLLTRRLGDSADGRIAVLGPGTFFGDLALLDNSPRGAQARAASNCKLAVFFRTDFMRLLKTHALIGSKISLQLARQIGLRLREKSRGGSVGKHL